MFGKRYRAHQPLPFTRLRRESGNHQTGKKKHSARPEEPQRRKLSHVKPQGLVCEHTEDGQVEKRGLRKEARSCHTLKSKKTKGKKKEKDEPKWRPSQNEHPLSGYSYRASGEITRGRGFLAVEQYRPLGGQKRSMEQFLMGMVRQVIKKITTPGGGRPQEIKWFAVSQHSAGGSLQQG